MAVFKAPRASTQERLSLILEESEIVFDTDLKVYFGGDGFTLGGFPLGKGSGIKVYPIELTESDILLKRVELPSTPFSPENVTLIPIGGIAQVNGEDFIIQNNILTWENLGLDGFLEKGETILVQL
jgi:hypothetical protein